MKPSNYPVSGLETRDCLGKDETPSSNLGPCCYLKVSPEDERRRSSDKPRSPSIPCQFAAGQGGVARPYISAGVQPSKL